MLSKNSIKQPLNFPFCLHFSHLPGATCSSCSDYQAGDKTQLLLPARASLCLGHLQPYSDFWPLLEALGHCSRYAQYYQLKSGQSLLVFSNDCQEMGRMQVSPSATAAHSFEFTLLKISFPNALLFRESSGTTPST